MLLFNKLQIVMHIPICKIDPEKREIIELCQRIC
jgi:hypothetical protein